MLGLVIIVLVCFVSSPCILVLLMQRPCSTCMWDGFFWGFFCCQLINHVYESSQPKPSNRSICGIYMYDIFTRYTSSNWTGEVRLIEA